MAPRRSGTYTEQHLRYLPIKERIVMKEFSCGTEEGLAALRAVRWRFIAATDLRARRAASVTPGFQRMVFATSALLSVYL